MWPVFLPHLPEEEVETQERREWVVEAELKKVPWPLVATTPGAMILSSRNLCFCHPTYKSRKCPVLWNGLGYLSCATLLLCSSSKGWRFLGKRMRRIYSRLSCLNLHEEKCERCIFRATCLLAVLCSPRPHIKRWVLQIPDVRWKCPSLPGSFRTLPRNGPSSGPLLHQFFP